MVRLLQTVRLTNKMHNKLWLLNKNVEAILLDLRFLPRLQTGNSFLVFTQHCATKGVTDAVLTNAVLPKKKCALAFGYWQDNFTFVNT